MSRPQLRFFQPNKKFFAYMEKYRNNIIVDIGAGEGHVALALEKKGFKVIAIDKDPKENAVYPTLPVDAETFKYPDNSVMLIARPCHGDFAYSAIMHALQTTVKTAIYVGLEHNVERDLTEIPYLGKIVEKGVGKEKEIIIELISNGKYNDYTPRGSCQSRSGSIDEFNPLVRCYPTVIKIRPVQVSIHRYTGVGQHYHVTAEEHHNPIVSPDGTFVSLYGDKDCDGRYESNNFNTPEEVSLWIEGLKKIFPPETHKIFINNDNTLHWFYKDGD